MSDELKRELRATFPDAPATVEIIDCTLRDGEQTPGVWFTVEEKVELAAMLSRAGVALLDAGFPASSDAEVEALQEMRRQGLSARIAATARPVRRDIEAAVRANAQEVFLFFPTSDLRMRETLGVDRAGAQLKLREGVEEAAGRGLGVNIVFEDATRSDLGFLTEILHDILRTAPVRRVVVADSVGCALPQTIEASVRKLRGRLPATTAVCIHGHNDYGLATATTVSAVIGGASAVTCTVNGIGERAGNADLAETVAALEHLLGIQHTVDPKALPALSSAVEQLTGIFCSATKPVTGFNVFRHESGIHVDAMLKNRRAYEHLPAGWVGRSHEYVLGKNSGTSLVRRLLQEAGIACSDELVHDLLGFVQTTTTSRPKSELSRAQHAKTAFAEVALAGVSPALVLSRAMKKVSGSFRIDEAVPSSPELAKEIG